MRSRRLLDTASDEFVRLAVKASATGVLAGAVYWFERGTVLKFVYAPV
ncbi:hypothetical protein ABK046_33650 [Streptomyces caeruleatus]